MAQNALSHSNRQEWVQWVDGAKEEASRKNSKSCCSIFFFFFGVFWDRISLYNPGFPGTQSVDQVGLELRNPPATASQVLGLKVCTTMPGFCILILKKDLCVWALPHMFVGTRCLWRWEEGIVSPRTNVTDGCELPCGCWQPNLGPLKEQ